MLKWLGLLAFLVTTPAWALVVTQTGPLQIHAKAYGTPIEGALYTWDFGDGQSIPNTKNLNEVDHTYAITGNYYIKVVRTLGTTTATQSTTLYVKDSVPSTTVPRPTTSSTSTTTSSTTTLPTNCIPLAAGRQAPVVYQIPENSAKSLISSTAFVEQILNAFGPCACNGLAILNPPDIPKLRTLQTANPDQASAYAILIQVIQQQGSVRLWVEY